MNLADYMGEALFHPGLGYYMSGDPLGRRGDFITAPEISQVFGELIGLWCAVTWRQMGAPGEINLVELGPGRGTLMRDALRAAGSVEGFAGAVQPYLMEISPNLRAIQKETLANGYVQPKWADHFAQIPEGPLLVLGNEFFDALPIRQLVRAGSGWCERMVDMDPSGEGFRYGLSPPSPLCQALVPQALSQAKEGDVVEIRPAAEAIIQAIAKAILEDGGAALIIDYGPGESATGDSFQALSHHQYCDPLADPGRADLTAHLDFQGLGRTAEEAGLKRFGPLGQGAFLKSLGIDERTNKLCENAAEDEAQTLRSGSDRLTAPGEMGDLFKVLALTHPAQPPPAGFEGCP